jgi:hypothetical protein
LLGDICWCMDMNCLFTLVFKHLVGLKRVRDGGLIHVDAVTWIFLCNLDLHKLYEVLLHFFCFLQVLLGSIGCCTVSEPNPFGE